METEILENYLKEKFDKIIKLENEIKEIKRIKENIYSTLKEKDLELLKEYKNDKGNIIDEHKEKEVRKATLSNSFLKIRDKFLPKPVINISIGKNDAYKKTCFSIVSRGGVGKTTFILNQINKWLKKDIKVLYINAEDDLHRIKEKINYNSLNEKHKRNFFCIPNETIFDLANYKYNIVKNESEIIEKDKTLYKGIRLFKSSEDNKRLIETEFLDDIKDIIKENDINVFIIDTFSLFYHIDTEIDNRIASELIGCLNAIANDLDITIGFIHHTNKSSDSIVSSGRGSSALYDGVRLSFTLSNAFESIINNSCKNPIQRQEKAKEIQNETGFDSIVSCECSKNNYGTRKDSYFSFKDGNIKEIDYNKVSEWFNELDTRKKGKKQNSSVENEIKDENYNHDPNFIIDLD